MIRLIISFLIAGLIFTPALATAEEITSTDDTADYVVGQFAVISFDEAKTPDKLANSTAESNLTPESLNQTRRGGEISARKIFYLRQAAREDFRLMGNESRELSVGLSSTAAQSVAIVCKQCVPESKKV